jgi:hypothetical protein
MRYCVLNTDITWMCTSAEGAPGSDAFVPPGPEGTRLATQVN